eukprot:TRINITY_DN10220_c0_g1_i1.p1 TRINITY_DN10220_c0_g1~~TRINITY_DN10220_c0_g1_i1.p1  ORF type:complete len:305 (-),score=41.12 TRINITY_DN10220_c0_g1_i1:216-1130(-)
MMLSVLPAARAASSSARSYIPSVVCLSRPVAETAVSRNGFSSRSFSASDNQTRPIEDESVSLSKLVLEEKNFDKKTLQSAVKSFRQQKTQKEREDIGENKSRFVAAGPPEHQEKPKLTRLNQTHPFFQRVEDPHWDDETFEKPPVPPSIDTGLKRSTMRFEDLFSKKSKIKFVCKFCQHDAPGSLKCVRNHGRLVKNPQAYYSPMNDPMNVPLLTQYMTPAGNILPRRYTGTCAKHQRALAHAIKRAAHMGFFTHTASTYRINSPYLTDLGETGKPYDPAAAENQSKFEQYRPVEEPTGISVGK